MAAMTASKALASSAPFSLPPLFSSPRPRCKYSPSLSRRAAASKERAFTSRARLLESCPSLHAGKVASRYSLASIARTASPKNSNCSLSRSAALLRPPLRNSGMAEAWVSARSSHSGRENRYPSCCSSSVALALMNDGRRLERCSFGRAELSCTVFLGFLRLGPACRLQTALDRCALGERLHSSIIVRSLVIGDAQQIVIHRVGTFRVLISFDGLLKFRDGVGEVSPANMHQTESTVGHDQCFAFGIGKGLFRKARRFGERGGDVNGTFRVVLRLAQLFIRIRSFIVVGPRQSLTEQRQHAGVVGIQLDLLFSDVQHFLNLLGGEINGDQILINRRTVAALRVFLKEVFRQLLLFGNIGCGRVLKGFEGRVLLRVHRR